MRTIYGRNPVSEALRAGRIHEVYYLPPKDKVSRKLLSRLRDKKIPCKEKDKHGLGDFCGDRHHQGFAAITDDIKNASLNRIYAEKEQGLRVVFISGCQDPGNFGAVVRNCEHFGIDLLILSAKGSCNVQTASVAKSSAGAIEFQPVLVSSRPEVVLQELKEKDFSIYALDGSGEESLCDAKIDPFDNICLIIGSEGEGIPLKMQKRCDKVLHIPRFGKINSLNLSCATAVACTALKL